MPACRGVRSLAPFYRNRDEVRLPREPPSPFVFSLPLIVFLSRGLAVGLRKEPTVQSGNHLSPWARRGRRPYTRSRPFI